MNKNISKAELDVLELMLEGLKNAEIASILGLSVRTVDTHVDKILKKLKARNRTEAVITAIKLSIIKLKPY